MEFISWTIVKFTDENTVEAIPTSWLLGSQKCYWPPFPKDKIINCIRRNERPNTCWPLHDICIFRNGTYDNYLTARNKARKAENYSDLNSDSDIQSRKLKKKKRTIASSSEEDDDHYFSSKLPLPPKMQKNASITTVEETDSDETNIHNESMMPSQKMFTNIEPSSSATKKTTDVSSSCCCCADHEMGATLKNLLKQQVLTRHIVNEILEDVKKMKQNGTIGNNTDSRNSDVPSIFLAFQHFPVDSEETLGLLEEYLSKEEHFKAAVLEISKIGGATTYDFMKRCLSSMLTNGFASQFSWLGAKKKKIFQKLKLAELLLEAAQANGLSINRKSSEDAIKAWLRRAKERQISSLKKLVTSEHSANDNNSILFFP